MCCASPSPSASASASPSPIASAYCVFANQGDSISPDVTGEYVLLDGTIIENQPVFHRNYDYYLFSNAIYSISSDLYGNGNPPRWYIDDNQGPITQIHGTYHSSGYPASGRLRVEPMLTPGSCPSPSASASASASPSASPSVICTDSDATEANNIYPRGKNYEKAGKLIITENGDATMGIWDKCITEITGATYLYERYCESETKPGNPDKYRCDISTKKECIKETAIGGFETGRCVDKSPRPSGSPKECTNGEIKDGWTISYAKEDDSRKCTYWSGGNYRLGKWEECINEEWKNKQIVCAFRKENCISPEEPQKKPFCQCLNGEIKNSDCESSSRGEWDECENSQWSHKTKTCTGEAYLCTSYSSNSKTGCRNPSGDTPLLDI